MIRRGQPEPTPRQKQFGFRARFSDGTVKEFWGSKYKIDGGALEIMEAILGPGGEHRAFKNIVIYAPHVWYSVEIIER